MRNVLVKSVAAVLAFAAAGAANAAIDTSAGGANGELFLTVWDATAGNEASFNIGLNVNVSNFNGNGSYSFTNLFADPTFQQFFGAGSAGGSNLGTQSVWRYNVVGASDLADQARVLFTQQGTGFSGLNNAATDNAAAATTTYLNALAVPAAANTAGTDVKVSPRYAGDFWGTNFNGAAPVSNAAFIGTALNFYSALDNQYPDYNTASDSPATMTQFAGTWLFSTAGNGTLTYAVAPVPLPAAAWLLGTGLIGLFGIGRRRDQA